MVLQVLRPIPAFITRLRSKNDISFSADYLGTCLIDTYRQSGDLYQSWDIVPMNKSGNFDRAPDARYGPDAPDGDYLIKDFTPTCLWRVYQVWDQNGWTKSDEMIYTDQGRLLCHKENG